MNKTSIIKDLKDGNIPDSYINNFLLSQDIYANLIVKKLSEKIPILKGVCNSFENVNHLQKELFNRKLYLFFNGIIQIDFDKMEEFVLKFQHRINKDFEHILNIINNIETEEKIDFIVMLFKELVFGNIDQNTFFRLCKLVQNLMLEDIEAIIYEHNFKSCTNTLIIENLEMTGLIIRPDYPTTGEYFETNSTDAYNITKLGKMLKDSLTEGMDKVDILKEGEVND